MIKLIFQVIASIASLWLADKFVPGVEIAGGMNSLLLVGTILGLINFFIKPILRMLTFPLRILTLGLIGIVINMAIIWLADIIFVELIITGLPALFWTSVIFAILNFVLVRD